MRDLELTCRPSHIIHGIYFLTFFSDMLVWHSIWHSFWYSIWHLFWYSFWHLSWHSIWHSILAFYLESILTFYSAILSGIHPGIHVACMLAFIMAFYRILSDSAFWHSPQWPVPTESWDLALASLRWRPAVPTEIWRSRLRSGGRKEGSKEGGSNSSKPRDPHLAGGELIELGRLTNNSGIWPVWFAFLGKIGGETAFKRTSTGLIEAKTIILRNPNMRWQMDREIGNQNFCVVRMHKVACFFRTSISGSNLVPNFDANIIPFPWYSAPPRNCGLARV